MTSDFPSFLRRHPNFFALVIGLVLCGLALGAVELVYRVLEGRRQGKVEYTPGGIESLIRTDGALGYRLRPNVHVNATKRVSGEIGYQASYTTDGEGWRAIPGAAATSTRTSTKGFVLFFGCSYTFGEGVNDDETFPAQVQRRAPAVHAYSFAAPGYGPQQMLEILKSGEPRKRAAEKEGTAIYLYIDDHLRRVLGSARVVASWGADMPYYDLDPTQGLVRRGTFKTGRRWITNLYGLLWKSAFVRYNDVDFPTSDRPDGIRIFLQIVRAAQGEFMKSFGATKERFVVVLWPDQRYNKEIAEELGKMDVRVLDETKLFPYTRPRYRHVLDGHPTPEAYGLLADEVVKVLDLR